jgi:phosphoglycerate dehydrogenase-like enzyme
MTRARVHVLSRIAGLPEALYDAAPPGAMAEVVVLDPSSSAASLDGPSVLVGDPGLVAEFLLGARAAPRDAAAAPLWVHSTFAGVDALERRLRGSLGAVPAFALTRSGGVMGGQMLEFAALHILAAERRLHAMRLASVPPQQGQQQQQNQQQDQQQDQQDQQDQQQRDGECQTTRVWDSARRACAPKRSLRGVRAAVLGFGDIGAHVARGLASAFGMAVTALCRTPRPSGGGGMDRADGLGTVTTTCVLGEALAGAEYVVNVLPSTPATVGLLEGFEGFERGAVFINAGRGDIASPASLIDAVRSGKLGGAVLDVFPSEPLRDDDPLWREERITITPHVAAMSLPSDVAHIFWANWTRREAGQPMLYTVDLASGY